VLGLLRLVLGLYQTYYGRQPEKGSDEVGANFAAVVGLTQKRCLTLNATT
jgi:hypothetical protein